MDNKTANKLPNPYLPRKSGNPQDPKVRATNFNEVVSGLTFEQAVEEASRCLTCKNAKCSAACPVNIDIPGFISFIKTGDIMGAHARLLESNFLSAICGRVCDQSHYCEGACAIKAKFGAVAVGLLERFVADWAIKHKGNLPSAAKDSGFKVACIGSGPASLTVAAELRRQGHAVTIFEALHEPGGVLIYGIPPFRLPREVVRAQIDIVRAMGVRIETDVVIGKTITVDELLEKFDAVFIGSGVGSPVMMNIPGEDLVGVYSANEFLTRMNLMEGYRFMQDGKDTPVPLGRNVLVVGGGNSAMDAARCALRLHPEKVTVMYRRTREEMPARSDEVEHAKEEGINFEFLTAPVSFEGDANGKLLRARCIRMKLGEPDAKGRRRPVPVAGSEFVVETDCVIEAIGQGPNPIIQKTTPGLETAARGVLKVLPGLKTTRPGVFAGGDIRNGGSTVLEAMKDGKTAASSINEYLSSVKAAK